MIARKMTPLGDDALENVSGGSSNGTASNNTYVVTKESGTFVYDDTDASGRYHGKFDKNWVIFVSGFEFIGKDGGMWLKVPAQRNVSMGYIRSIDVAKQNFTINGNAT